MKTTLKTLLFFPWALIQLLLTALYLPVVIYIVLKNLNNYYYLDLEFKRMKISKLWVWWNELYLVKYAPDLFKQ